MNDAERVLDKIIKTDKNVYLELVQANMEKENAKSSTRIAQFENTDRIEEEVNKRVNERLNLKDGSAIKRGFSMEDIQ